MYFQVNTVPVFRTFCIMLEDIYIMVVLSALVLILNPNPMILTLLPLTVLYLTHHAVIV